MSHQPEIYKDNVPETTTDAVKAGQLGVNGLGRHLRLVSEPAAEQDGGDSQAFEDFDDPDRSSDEEPELLEADESDENDSQAPGEFDNPEGPSDEELELIAIEEEASGVSVDALDDFLPQAAKIKLLTARDEALLAQRIERGDLDAKERMAEANILLVVSIAARWQGHGLDMEDLVMEGMPGLMRAVEKFDWRRGYKFSTYATWWIKQAVQRAVYEKSKNIRSPVHIAERRFKLGRVKSELLIKLGREPTLEEMADEANMPMDQARTAWDFPLANVSLDELLPDSDSAFGDFFADEATSDTAGTIYAAQRKTTIEVGIGTLSEREQRVIEGRFFSSGKRGRQKSLEQIGNELGITRERVRQVEAAALSKLASLDEIKELHEKGKGTPSQVYLDPEGRQYTFSASNNEVLRLFKAGRTREEVMTALEMTRVTVDKHFKTIKYILGEDTVKAAREAAAQLLVYNPRKEA